MDRDVIITPEVRDRRELIMSAQLPDGGWSPARNRPPKAVRSLLSGECFHLDEGIIKPAAADNSDRWFHAQLS